MGIGDVWKRKILVTMCVYRGREGVREREGGGRGGRKGREDEEGGGGEGEGFVRGWWVV